jgi:hypothetical protein
MTYHDKTLGFAAALATGMSLMAAVPATASTMTINFESGYSDNDELADGHALLDSAGNPTNVTISTPNENTMSVEAAGDSGASTTDDDTSPDSFWNDPLGGAFEDTESAGFENGLGNFFLRNTTALTFDAGAVNPVFSLLFGGKGAAMVSAEIWDIDGNDSQGTERWTLNAYDNGGVGIGEIVSPKGTTTADDTSLNGQPWEFTFSDIGAISRIDFNFTGSKTSGIGVAFDNLSVTAVPLPASALLLLGGLGGLGGVSALRRRKRAA